MLVLSILHSIFLSEEEALRLINGEEVQVVGVSLPVWYSKGNTSEPAEEVFCKYVLTNKPEYIPVKTENDGYLVNIPSITEQPKDWEKMPEHQKIEWTSKNVEGLLPKSKNGNEYMHFKEFNKIKKKGKFSTIVHVFEIKYMKSLIESLA